MLGAASLRADTPVAKRYAGHPLVVTLLIDTQMSNLETMQAISGFDDWTVALPKTDLVLRYGRIEHNTALAANAPDDWIYVIRRMHASEVQVDCKKATLKVGCFDYVTRHLTLDMGDTAVDERSTLAAHELGHALGLKHCPEFTAASECKRSIMNDTTNAMIEITPTDIKEFCRLNGCEKTP